MRIIKLEVERFGSRGIEVAKYAVSLDLKRHYKIGRFVEYVKNICKLDNLSYELELDGFLISQYDRTKALKENLVYKLKISRGSSMVNLFRSSRVQNIGNEELLENKQRMREQLARSQKKSKFEQKIEKARRKKRKEQSSDSQSSSSSSQEQGQSCSDSSIPAGQLQQKLLKKAKVVASSSSSSSSSSSESRQRPINKRPEPPIMPKAGKLNKPHAVIKKIIPSQSSSSSSSSSQSEKQLPSIKQQQTVTISRNAQQSTNQFNNVPQKATQNRPNQIINPVQKPKLICGDSSSESQPSQYQPKKKSQVPSKPTTEKQKEKPFQSIEVKSKVEVKLPPALRNKFVKKNFDQHKENQWINVEKDKIKKWRQLGNASICQPNNKIRFKIVELDEEKFIPVKSSWITAQVKEVHTNGTVSLIKVEQEGKPYRQTYELPEHNMDELQLNRLLATKEQVECFSTIEETAPKQDEKHKQSNKDNEVEVFEISNDKNSLQKFICGQANYYFSDKNYNFDLFMQMHANRHPEKYLNISILLNFPKIKKFLKDEAKLYEYLKTDQRYAQRNYEINFENRMIRKKVVVKAADVKKAVEESNKPKNNVENVERNEQTPKQIENAEQKGEVNS